MAVADDGGSQPDPLDELRDCDACRRDVLRGIGAAGGAAGVGGAGIVGSTGTVLADDLIDGSFEGICDSPAQYALPISCAHADPDADATDPDPDAHMMHQLATDAWEDYQSHHVLLDNYLEDTSTIASLESRDGIAEDWETGEPESEAYNTVSNRVRGYYNTHENLHFWWLARMLWGFSYINSTDEDHGGDSDDLPGDGFIIVHVDEFTGTDLEKTVVSPVRETVDWEHHDGEPVADDLTDADELEVPCIRVRGDGEEHDVPLTQDVLDSYDPTDGTFALQPEGSNETWYTTLRLQVLNVTQEDGEDLEAQEVFDGGVWAELWQEIESQSDRVMSNYDLELVEQLYAALDEGRITPEQVRGIEGHARYLSGQDDVNADAFQMALLQGLNMEQPDLTNVAHMEAEYTGFTRRNLEIDENNDGANQIPADHVENRELKGLMYARGTPADGLESAHTYAVGHNYLYASDGFAAVSPESGEIMFRRDDGSVRDVAVSQDGRYGVRMKSNNGGMAAYDLIDEERVVDTGSDTEAVGWCAPNLALACEGNSIAAYNVDTGSQEWSANINGTAEAVFGGPDGEYVYGGNSDAAVSKIDAETGSVVWTVGSDGSNTRHIAAGEGYVVHGGGDYGGVHLHDDEDGEVVATWDENYGIDMDSITISDGYVYTEVGDGLTKLSLPDLEFEWQQSHSGYADLIVAHPGDDTFEIIGYETHEVRDRETGEVVDSNPGPDPYDAADYPRPPNADGWIDHALFYDAETGEQVELVGGTLELLRMEDTDGEAIEDPQFVGDTSPDYDTRNIDDYVEQVEIVEKYQETYYVDENGAVAAPGSDEILDWLRDLLPNWAWWIVGGVLALAGYSRLSGD